MLHINVEDLKPNNQVILDSLDVKKNTTLVKKNLKIIFPDRFINRGLANIGNHVKLLGLYAIVDEDNNFSVFFSTVFHDVVPYIVHDATCSDGAAYKVLEIEKGTPIITDHTVLVTDNFIFDICDEIYIKGRIPWYISNDMLPDILGDSGYLNDSSISNDRLIFEILSSLNARGDNKTDYFRHSHPEVGDSPKWVALNDIYLSYKNTGSQLIGGYYSQAITKAVLEPEEESTVIERQLIGKMRFKDE